MPLGEIIGTAHGKIARSVVEELGGTPEQAAYKRYLYAAIWSPGVYETILVAFREARVAAEKRRITQEHLAELLADAKDVWERYSDRNPDHPADAVQIAEAKALGILK